MTRQNDRASGSDRGALCELSEGHSLRLLGSHGLGRLAFAHEGWPIILPVNYAFDDPSIVIRTGLGAMLEDVPLHAAAFEIDDADPAGSWGWSVLIHGPAFDITSAHDERSVHLRQLVLHPSPSGIHNHWLSIAVVAVSGRYFGELPANVIAELEPVASHLDEAAPRA